jgi:dipeptidyl aminopeptidase/acylaminoacyl peptidase
MAETREVFEMATKEMKPDQSSWSDQQTRQRRRARNRRIGTYAVVAVVLLAVGAFGLTQMLGNSTPISENTGAPSVSTSTPVVGVTQPVIVGLDGSVQQLHGIPVDAQFLNISPDGRQIVFVAEQDGSPQVGAVGIDGSGPRFITHVAPVSIGQDSERGPLTPAWSPDGSRIAFSNGHIYVVNADGSGLTQLTFGTSVDQWPSWSPDGSTIAYSNSGSTPLDSNTDSITLEIWTVPASGGTPTRLTHLGGSDMPAYSPDGSQIAFTYQGGIFLMDANGQNVHLLKGLSPGNAYAPRWSPDGKSLAYVQFSGTYSHDPAMKDGPLQRASVVNLATGVIQRIPGKVVEAFNTVQWLPTGDALLQNRYTG